MNVQIYVPLTKQSSLILEMYDVIESLREVTSHTSPPPTICGSYFVWLMKGDGNDITQRQHCDFDAFILYIFLININIRYRSADQ